MSEFADLAALKVAVAEWLDRADLTPQIPKFIRLCEAELSRKLRTLDGLCRAQVQTDRHYTKLPDNWLEARHVELTSAQPPYPLTFRAPYDMPKLRACGPENPRHYSIIGRTLELAPIPAGMVTIDMLYYERFPVLVAETDSNWILAKHPDLYLYTTLKASAPFLKNDVRLGTWAGLANETLTEITNENLMAEVSGGPISTRQSVRIG